MNILFVEDNANTAMAMKAMLELRGFRVDTVSGVNDAVRKLAVGGYDLLISDINLPDGTGHDILASASSPIPAIAVSGHGADADRAAALRSGFAEYLTKPFRMDELITAIRKVHPND